MKINLNYMKVGLCPFCGVQLPRTPIMVQIQLNNNSIMPQPACETDVEKLKTIEGQKAILIACKAVWILELTENKERSEEDRIKELKRIAKLDITSAM